MIDLTEVGTDNAVIKVIGIGGGGCNAVEHMLHQSIEGVEFICSNTDAQALNNTTARTLVQIGRELTKGLGAGADPEIGRRSTQADSSSIPLSATR